MILFDGEKEIIEVLINICKKTEILPKDIPEKLSTDAQKLLKEAIEK